MNASQRRAWRRKHAQEYIGLVAKLVMVAPRNMHYPDGPVNSHVIMAKAVKNATPAARHFIPFDLHDVKALLNDLSYRSFYTE